MVTINSEVRYLRDNLTARPGTLLLLAGTGADKLAADLSAAWESDVVSVGSRAADMARAAGRLDAPKLLSDGEIFTDLDVLFWAPALKLDVMALFRRTARRGPVALVWPGVIENQVARYSEPGRKDFSEWSVGDDIVLRAKPHAYADELPYTLELGES